MSNYIQNNRSLQELVFSDTKSNSKAHTQTKTSTNLNIPDFFAPVPISVLTSPEYNQLKAGARDCFVRMCMFRNTKERYLQRVIHQKTGQNFDLWDGTLKGRLTDKLVEMMGVAADTVRGYIKELVKTGFLHECPRWKKIGNTRRYVISHYQDPEAIQKYLDTVVKTDQPKIQVVETATQQVEPTNQPNQTPVNTSVSLSLDSQSKLNSSSSQQTESQLPIPDLPDSESDPIPLNPNLHLCWKHKTGRVPSAAAIQRVLSWGESRFDLSPKQFETALIEGLDNWDGQHPDGGYVEHITWLEKDSRAYDGTTGDWLIDPLKRQGWLPPKPKNQTNIQPQTPLQIELTQSQDDLEATKQRIEQDQQKKLQHRQEIDQGIVKPMPDNLQQRINRLGNTKG